ncbi:MULTISPECIES: hypothetical protein [Paenibacillus]|uniref:Uncharacterized protein n=2 Tax=Paenibacillus TaxID=44249 RepID=A0A7H0Y2P3_9BACL|nr:MULTISPECIES: hypothetical protein [Paenibacillus]MDR6779555.1 hypothetical protein [Paenibacillus peoriae]MDY8021084.1 hypothetical protein [Paenibacillus polymyxa]ODA09134.1 hypothetical protein A7312_27350 [Paenibacillus polymyxa]QNR65351.1 hypothetical protein IAQ67_15760 [Paenibacillus peoriae]
MKVDIRKPLIEAGSIVEIEGNYYIVNELPSCVYYETRPHWRFYLHNLNGTGFYNYPVTIEVLSQTIHNEGWKVYSSKHFKLIIEDTD